MIQLDYPPRTLLGHLQRPIAKLVGRPMIGRMLAKLKRLIEDDAPET